jgi:hypothetical protein
MFTCGHCQRPHHYAATARACSQDRTFVCDWLVQLPGQEYTDFEPIIRECGATAVVTERGFECEAGHEHVNAETRDAEGWDYASDEEEAAVRAKYGYESRLPDGHVFIAS